MGTNPSGGWHGVMRRAATDVEDGGGGQVQGLVNSLPQEGRGSTFKMAAPGKENKWKDKQQRQPESHPLQSPSKTLSPPSGGPAKVRPAPLALPFPYHDCADAGPLSLPSGNGRV